MFNGVYFANLKKSLKKSFSKQNLFIQLQQWFPILVWLPKYQLSADLRYDIIAGITVGLTMVPQCLAYAQMCNVRGEFGLYSAFAGQFFYIAMGTSKDASVGPSAISSMLAGQAHASANPFYEKGDGTCCAIMSLISGCILLVMGLLKLGFIVNFFSIPVVSGFTSAAGFTIASSQLKNFFGLKKNPSDVPGAFVRQIKNVVDNHHEINWNDVAFGASAIGFLLFMQYLPLMVDAAVKKWVRLDSEKRIANYASFNEVLKLVVASRNVILFFIATGTAYSVSGNPSIISLVGKIKPGLPSLAVPSFELVDYRKVNITINNGSSSGDGVNNYTTITERVVIKESQQLIADLIVAYIVLPLLGAMELFAITKALGRKNGYSVDARQELVAIGVANIFHAFLNGVPVTAAVTRCALNDQCRIRTQIGSLISAIIVMIAISELTPIFFYIPKATLAAIIIVAALNLVDYHIVPDMWNRSHGDCILLLFTFVICVFFEISYGVLFCLFLNMLMFLKAVARMQLQITRKQLGRNYNGSDDSTICVVRLSHGMKYPSADKFLDKINALLRKESHLIIDCAFVQSVDYTGIQAFRSLLLSAVKRGNHVMFTNLNDEVHNQLEALGLEQFRFIGSVEEAVAEYNKAFLLSEVEGAAMRMTSIPEDQDITANIEEVISPRHTPVDDEAREIHERARRRLIRRLSVEPSFYQEIPFTVGGNVDLPGAVPDVVINADAKKKGFKPPNSNVQFMNRILLREVSRNSPRSRASSIIQEDSTQQQQQQLPLHQQQARQQPSSSISRIATTEIIEPASNPSELWDALQRISISPALRFIDLSDLSEFSPRNRNSNPVEDNLSP